MRKPESIANSEFIDVANRDEAWKIASELFGLPYEKDERISTAAGYPVYFSTKKKEYSYIVDRGYAITIYYVGSDDYHEGFSICPRSW